MADSNSPQLTTSILCKVFSGRQLSFHVLTDACLWTAHSSTGGPARSSRTNPVLCVLRRPAHVNLVGEKPACCSCPATKGQSTQRSAADRRTVREGPPLLDCSQSTTCDQQTDSRPEGFSTCQGGGPARQAQAQPAMCRLMAYMGPPVLVADVVLWPDRRGTRPGSCLNMPCADANMPAACWLFLESVALVAALVAVHVGRRKGHRVLQQHGHMHGTTVEQVLTMSSVTCFTEQSFPALSEERSAGAQVHHQTIIRCARAEDGRQPALAPGAWQPQRRRVHFLLLSLQMIMVAPVFKSSSFLAAWASGWQYR